MLRGKDLESSHRALPKFSHSNTEWGTLSQRAEGVITTSDSQLPGATGDKVNAKENPKSYRYNKMTKAAYQEGTGNLHTITQGHIHTAHRDIKASVTF